MSRPDFTVLGCTGTIGTALTAALRASGQRVLAVGRADLPGLLASGQPAGHVISCIGLTGDFRTRPLETAAAHVDAPARCLADLHCKSFLYLSSTRVYARASATHEDAPLCCLPADPSDLYNLTKLTGEALCLTDPRPGVRVVRLSNVYGSSPGDGTFLGQVLTSGRATGRVLLRQGKESEKDYISLADVVRLLPAIASGGRHRLYNLAAGRNTSHAEIAAILAATQGWQIDFAEGAPTMRFPPVDVGRLNAEFAGPTGMLASDLAALARVPSAELQTGRCDITVPKGGG